MKFIMALDAGTTSNRCILFDKQGRIRSMAQHEFTQIFPKPGWVEHDPLEIWSTMLGTAVEAMSKVNARADDTAAIGGRPPSSGTSRPGSRCITPLSGSAAERRNIATS